MPLRLPLPVLENGLLAEMLCGSESVDLFTLFGLCKNISFLHELLRKREICILPYGRRLCVIYLCLPATAAENNAGRVEPISGQAKYRISSRDD